MANGVAAFRGIQAGRQGGSSTRGQGFGTGVAATIFMLGTMQLTPQTQFYNAREERRSRVETHRVTPVAQHGEMRFESSLQFQRAPHWFAMLLGDPGGRPTLAGNGFSAISDDRRNANTQNPNHSLYTGAIANYYAYRDSDGGFINPETNNIVTVMDYEFTPYADKLALPPIWTIEYGDNAAFYRMIDCYLRSLTLRWAMNDAVMLSADIFGKFPVERAVTEGIPQPSVNDAVSQFTDVYIGDVTEENLRICSPHKIDASSAWSSTNPYLPELLGLHPNGTLMTSAELATFNPSVQYHEDAANSNQNFATNPLVAMRKDRLCNAIELTIPTGFEMTRYTGSDIDFSDLGQMYRTITANLTLRHSTDGRTEFDKYVNDAERRRLFRFVIRGPEIYGGRATVVGVTGVPYDDDDTVITVDDSDGNPPGESHADFSYWDPEPVTAVPGHLPINHHIVIDLTALYSEAPQFFTEQGGDDLFTMQASGYHEPNRRWDRDLAVHVVTDRPNMDSDSQKRDNS